MIYINLPVTNLEQSTQFYQQLGFIKNDHFSDSKASGMEWMDGSFRMMLLTHEFTKGFLPPHKTIADSRQTCAVLNAIQLSSKQEVDRIFDLAIAHGAQETKSYDHGFMYGKDFEDADGYIWELFWMDEATVPPEA